MNASRETEILETLEPRNLAVYLASSGWELDHTRGSAAEVWRLGTQQKPQTRLLLPRDRDYADFNARLLDALRLLASLHEYDLEQLATRVLATTSDVFYIRADQATTEASIPLNEGFRLIDGARQMLLAAACSAIQPRASYQGRRPSAAKSFLDEDCRLGHTQRGSFIITVLARLGEPESAQVETRLRVDPTVPEQVRVPSFQRRVMTTLSTGLVAAAQATTEESLPASQRPLRPAPVLSCTTR